MENVKELTPNERRTIHQQSVHQKWVDTGARGFVLACTGYGKSRIGTLAIKRCLSTNSERKVVIIVPSTIIYKQWNTIVEKNKWKNVKVYIAHTYLSLTQSERNCDLLIVDECHRFSNEDSIIFSKIIDKTRYKWIQCLSATLDQPKIRFLESRDIIKIAEITIEEAEQEQYVSQHTIFALGVEMSPEDEATYKKLTDEFNKYFGLFGYDFDYLKRLLSSYGAQARAMEEDNRGWDRGTCYGVVVKAFKSMRARKEFLQKTESKVQAVKQLTELFEGKKTITFSEYTDFADRVTEAIGTKSRSYHSSLTTKYFAGNGKQMDITDEEYKQLKSEGKKIKKKGATVLKRETFEKFSKNKIKILNTARAVDEGADIQGVEVGIIASYSSKPLQLAQRLGRCVRYAEGKKAYIIILYLKSQHVRTQDVRWLKKALVKVKEPVWVDSIEEIAEMI